MKQNVMNLQMRGLHFPLYYISYVVNGGYNNGSLGLERSSPETLLQERIFEYRNKHQVNYVLMRKKPMEACKGCLSLLMMSVLTQLDR
jgi:hypothetical protein